MAFALLGSGRINVSNHRQEKDENNFEKTICVGNKKFD